ncbi:MAG: universal stress protein [Nitrospirae bacterium]|jgi:nucleotide-binding universal stress UspA family protein|nr:universal stress protein [Nitrospirota bacterium]
MYRKILAAVNEFTNSELAARYALTLSQSCDAKLFLIFVAEEGIEKNTFKRAESALERLFIDAESRGIEVKSITEKGEPYKNIYDIVRKEHIDLVFTATRREDVTKRFFIKTIARELILKMPCSVAMVRIVRMGRIHPTNILVPLRGMMKDIEERAFFVGKLASGFNSKVTIFHCPEPLTDFFHGRIYLNPAVREKHIPGDIETFTEYLNKYVIINEKRTSYGTISKAITIEAAHKRNDLIIMGASERSLLKSIISGNPVEEVLKETPCDLIILKSKK